jgi:hypothetical protein
MKKSKGLNILIGFIGLLLVVSLISTLFVWLRQDGSDNPDDNPNPQATIKLIVDEYTLYENEELNFKFLIAKVTLQAEEPQKVSTSQFVTSQQINLSESAVYINDLATMKVGLEDQNIDYDTFETTDNISLTLFIPIRLSDSDTLTLFFQGEEEASALFDLTKNMGDFTLLVNEDANVPDGFIEEILVEDNYKIKIVEVSNIAYKSLTETQPDGSKKDIVLPSTGQVIGVLLEVESLNDQSIIIEDAKYTMVEGNQVSSAYKDNVTAEGFTNIINKPIVSAANGYVFFDVYTPDGTTLDQLSEFEFKLNNSEDWIKVKVKE